MFLNVVDFSLVERFAKYYHFSSHYRKIVVNKYQSLPKFSQFGQNVSDIFWICLSHIVLEKQEHRWFHHSGHVTQTFDKSSKFHDSMGIDSFTEVWFSGLVIYVIRLLSKHFWLQLYFPKDSVFFTVCLVQLFREVVPW